MNDLLRSFDDEHHLWRLAGGTKAWRFRSRGGDNLAVVNSSCCGSGPILYLCFSDLGLVLT